MYVVVMSAYTDWIAFLRLANTADVIPQFRFDRIVNQGLALFGAKRDVNVNV